MAAKALLVMTAWPERRAQVAREEMAAMPDWLPAAAAVVMVAMAAEVATAVMGPMASREVTGRPEALVQQAVMPGQPVSEWKIPRCRCPLVVAFTLRHSRETGVMVAMAARLAQAAREVKPVEAVKAAMPAKRAGAGLADMGHRVAKEVMPVSMELVLLQRQPVGMAEIPATHTEVTMGEMAEKASGATMA